MSRAAIAVAPEAGASHPLWQFVFGNPRPVEVEIGCGTGTFILAAAAAAPATNFFGIERSYRRARMVEAGRSERRLDNVRVLDADAGCVVAAAVPDASVAAYHIYFPDPWWKRRHFRRRYFTPEFAAALERTLVPGGRLFLATDVEEVMQRMVAAVESGSALAHEPGMRSPRTDPTVFERKGLARGAVIREAVYRKRDL